MSQAISEARALIDEFLLDCDFRAAYEISIHAAAPVVYERVLTADFYASWIARLLMSLRTGKRIPRNRPAGDLRQRFQGSGFFILGEAPGEEVVIGVAGRFWRPDGGRLLDLSAGDFAGFSRAGFAKVAMNFQLRPQPPGGTVLSTETRIKCCDRSAWWKFRLYWALVRPFSGVIRKAILRQVKAEAEAAAERLPGERNS